MPTLEIRFAPRAFNPIFTVTLENGKTYTGQIHLEEPYPIFTHGPWGTVTFDSEEDLVGNHACTCVLTEARSKVTTAKGVIIDNSAPGEPDEGDNPREIKGSIYWDD